MSPITVVPELVELTEFARGWLPDLDEAAVPADGLIDVNNLLPDRATGVIETRKGFKRFGDFAVLGYVTRALHSYNFGHGSTNELGKQFLMVVVSNSTDTPNNVQVYRINVQDGTSTRVDTVGRQWRHKPAQHFGVTIDNVYYGGSERDPIYSWRPYFSDGSNVPTDEQWDPDATMGQYASSAWTDGAVYAIGDRVRDDKQFTRADGTTYTRTWVYVATRAHTAGSWNRPKDGKNSGENWEAIGRHRSAWSGSSVSYAAGDVVSYEVSSGGSADLRPNFPRSYRPGADRKKSTFVCVRDHTSSAAKTPVADIASWGGTGLWEPARGPISNTATYHGSRLFIRDSDAGTSRLRYSKAVKADGFWDATDWDLDDVQGAGWMDIRTGDGDDITALHELGNYLVICKRRSTHVLAGLNPSTWALRKVGDVGCIYKKAICELEGLVYFFGDQGLMMTDGAIVQEVAGAENFRDWIRANVSFEEGNAYRIAMTAFDGKLWLSLPSDGAPSSTIVYDPATQSLWKLDFGTWEWAVNRLNRIDELFFAAATNKVTQPGLVMQYNKSDANDADDDYGTTYAAQPVSWKARFGWLSFGAAKEDRKPRRIWATVRAVSKNITMKAYRNYSNNVVWTKSTALGSTFPVQWVEGQMLPDSNAVSIELSGTDAPVSIVGWALHSIFRRKRFHRA